MDEQKQNLGKIPRLREDDYVPEAAALRREFVKEATGVDLNHVAHYKFDPHVAAGNIEHFMGVAQVPVGLAGPLLVRGEHAQGEFHVPLATTEGTLVASYNRGMKVLGAAGGVTTTISADSMQRAPVFVFHTARAARDFIDWVETNEADIADAAEQTTRVGKLVHIQGFQSNKFAFLRFNYATGDAAGQNMVSKATHAACEWIRHRYCTGQGVGEGHHEIEHFYLEGNMATDKKASQINLLHNRGKRVTAEAVVPGDLLRQMMRVDPETFVYHNQVGNVGSMMAGVNNNGAHSANGITAIFIATGQDVANIAESSAAIFHTELTRDKDLYISITLPSLIVATHGGGTGLPTQNECLRLLGCSGTGTVNKFAEIVAATVLAGELSLVSAISASDWVTSHEEYGRNR